MSDFDLQSELSALKAQTEDIRKRSYSKRKSRLDKHTSELLLLHKNGVSVAELQRWLRSKHRINVEHSTVARWLKKNG